MRSSVNNDSNNNEGTIIIHGKIIIHDRNRVQSEVLPIYFNHASFASLRRQLSYFSFVRVGKNRHQSHVMYTNDAVVDLSDILKLKRRTTTATTTAFTAPVTAATSPRAAIATMTTTTLVEDYQGQVIADSRLTGRSNSKTSVKDSQRKVRLHSLDLRDVLRQQQQQQEDLHHSNVSSAADVASAVLSGTLHAAKSNDNLDTTTAARGSKSGGGERVIRPMRAPVLPLCHRRSTPLTTSYADSSMSHSSDNEVEEGGEEDISNNNKSSSITGSNDDDEEGLQQHYHAANITTNNNCNNNKRRHHHHEQQQQQQQQSSSSTTVKPNDIITRKVRTKLDRLLSVNNIVPFIHLPSSHYSAANKILSRGNKRRKMSKKEVATTEEEYVDCGWCVNIEGKHDKEGMAGSDAAVNALLALGSHPL